MPHILLHGLFIYNGNLRGPVIVAPVADRLEVELLLPVLTTVATGDRTPISRMLVERSTIPLWTVSDMRFYIFLYFSNN